MYIELLFWKVIMIIKIRENLLEQKKMNFIAFFLSIWLNQFFKTNNSCNWIRTTKKKTMAIFGVCFFLVITRRGRENSYGDDNNHDNLNLSSLFFYIWCYLQYTFCCCCCLLFVEKQIQTFFFRFLLFL